MPGWALAFLLLAALSYRPMSPRWGVGLPIVLLALSVLIHLWMPVGLANLSAGVFLGAMVSLLHRLGGHLAARPRREQPRPARLPGSRARLTRSLFRAAPGVLAIFLVSQDRAEARRGARAADPGLAPLRGNLRARAAPRQVVLRESDYQLLQSLARPPALAQTPLLILTDATHHVTRADDREVVLSSELSIRATAPGSATWRVPVGGAREISATLEGRPVPVFMEAGGQQAAIPIQGSGTFRLQVRRTATLRHGRPGGRPRFPGQSPPLGPAHRRRARSSGAPRLLNARGNLKIGPDSAVNAELGPADHVEIQWGNPDAGSPVTGLTVDGVILWDIEPAGDRIQARFTYRGARRLSTLRFKMDPGLIVRSARIPGMITGAWSGAADQPVWTARLDPPLPDGATIELDLWRPLETGPAGKASGPPRDRSSAEPARRFPLLEPLQVERFTSLLGVRRPGHWTGRLEAPTGAEALSDESFVKTWGPLPDERLTLSGTTRLVRDKLPTFRTAPAAALVRTRPTLELRIDAGRVDVLLRCRDRRSGRIRQLARVTVPQDLILLGVESDGLTDWSRPEPRRLLLRFDREAARSRRRLKITGWIPTAEDPMKVGIQQLQHANPLARHPGHGDPSGPSRHHVEHQDRGDRRTRHDAGLVRSRGPPRGLPTSTPRTPIASTTPRGSARFSGPRPRHG